MISIYKLDFIGIEIFTRWTWNTPCSPISIGRITPASTPSTSLKYTTTDAFCPCRRPLRASRESQITFLKSSGARIFWKLEKILTSFHFYQKFYSKVDYFSLYCSYTSTFPKNYFWIYSGLSFGSGKPSRFPWFSRCISFGLLQVFAFVPFLTFFLCYFQILPAALSMRPDTTFWRFAIFPPQNS